MKVPERLSEDYTKTLKINPEMHEFDDEVDEARQLLSLESYRTNSIPTIYFFKEKGG